MTLTILHRSAVAGAANCSSLSRNDRAARVAGPGAGDATGRVRRVAADEIAVDGPANVLRKYAADAP